MTSGSPATLPAPGLPGLDPRWSRLVITPGLDGVGRTWHVLDNEVQDPTLTLLCVHGNPTWSYLWRGLIGVAPPGVRVVAMDQLDMGYSERTGITRRLAQRVEDLCALTDALDLAGPVVTVAHDWGGPISLGWVQRNLSRVAGMVLANTAVEQPPGSSAPRLIRMVRAGGILKTVCVRTPAFIRGAMALARPRLAREIREAYESPYRSADRRKAIGAFVEDIPLSVDHPSRGSLDRVIAGLGELANLPALLLWGTSDPVFSDTHLRDLSERLPGAQIHRFIGAGHLVPEGADVASAVFAWVGGLGNLLPEPSPVATRGPLWASLDRRTADTEVALVEMGPDGVEASVSFAELDVDVRRMAAGLVDFGVAKGDRVALLVPPGIDLAVCVYACWRMGAVVVIADAGLGARGMGRALTSADPAYLIGVPRAMAAAKTLRWPGIRISTRPMRAGRMLGMAATLDDLRRRGEGLPAPLAPSVHDVAGIGFTSGATGPPKGVVYRHGQLQAQRDALEDLYDIRSADRLVAAFGPFALFGPSMGITSVVPDMDVTAPGSLTAQALGDAVASVNATLVFASPAALANVASTAGELSPAAAGALGGIRLVMAAGAPVRADLLRSACALMPNAKAHTPYGMTEVLPVADIGLEDIVAVGQGNGVCVGRPVPGVEVAISAIDSSGRATGQLTTETGVVGEICIRAAHMRDGYDKLWVTQQAASRPAGWHRSGDVGHLDEGGRLWVEGRMGHMITTPRGPITPVGVEQAVLTLPGVTAAAAVGVGPQGVQQLVVVVVVVGAGRRPGLADEDLTDAVREKVPAADVASVLTVPSLPVDKRHNSKVDRSAVARWAEGVLAGGRVGRI